MPACRKIVAALVVVASMQFAAPALTQESYVPDEESARAMTAREARAVLRKMGRVGVGWDGRDQFIGGKYEVGIRAVVIHGERGGWLRIWYDGTSPRVEQISGLFSGSRSVVRLGITGEGTFKEQLLYYSGSGDLEYAKKIALALVVLRRAVERELGPKADAEFADTVKQFRAADPKPQLTEEVRKYLVQAEAAVREKDYQDAVDLFGEVVRIAPWYPEGHFNYAMLLGEIGELVVAVHEMKRYLALVPDVPNAREAQDKIYEWERKIRK